VREDNAEEHSVRSMAMRTTTRSVRCFGGRYRWV
jgi:hypothetical protein